MRTASEVRELRRSLRFGQHAIAKAASVSIDKFNRWERGKAKFSKIELERIDSAMDQHVSMRKTSAQKVSSHEDIKCARLVLGLSQKDLARIAHSSQSIVSITERGFGTSQEIETIKKAINGLIEQSTESDCDYSYVQMAAS